MTGIASRAQLRMSLLRYGLVTVPMLVLLGALSGRIAGTGPDNRWFAALAKPEFMPPGWVFGAVWTGLYAILGIVLAMLLHARGARRRGAVIGLFVVQLIANYAWAPLFFGFHKIEAALELNGAMIVLTVALIVLAWNIRRVAALMLVPYLAWLCFAAVLTASILSLNPNAEVAPQPPSADIVL